MAVLARRRPENVEGSFFVDGGCIDCETCRWMAPSVFAESGGQSAVVRQPVTEEDRHAAFLAIVACPTASIGTVSPEAAAVSQAAKEFPVSVADNVFHCGYHSEDSYGAAGYFIQRPDGNVLVDSPRFAAPLVKRLEEMGGVRFMFLTHRDDVADHEKFQRHFGLTRIMHNDDVTRGTSSVEQKIFGKDPIQLAPGLTAIPTPGHTKGHIVLLLDGKFLFTGDHLAWSAKRGHLIGFRNACWYSWSEQIESMKALCRYEFEWVLPGHGRRFHAEKEKMRMELEKCAAWMETM